MDPSGSNVFQVSDDNVFRVSNNSIFQFPNNDNLESTIRISRPNNNTYKWETTVRTKRPGTNRPGTNRPGTNRPVTGRPDNVFTRVFEYYFGQRAEEPPTATYLRPGPTVNLTQDERDRYEAWATTLTWAAMGLQSQLPEIEPTALMEFVESPQVARSFIEFARDFWCQNPDITSRSPGAPQNSPPRRVIDMLELEEAVRLFDGSMFGRPVGESGIKANWKPRHHIVHFLRSVYRWAMQDAPNLAMRDRLVGNSWQRAAILVGALAACIRVYELGRFRNIADVTRTFGPLLSNESWTSRHNPQNEEARRRSVYLANQTAREQTRFDGRVSHAEWFTHFAFYARTDFIIPRGRGNTYRWYSDLGFMHIEKIARENFFLEIELFSAFILAFIITSYLYPKRFWFCLYWSLATPFLVWTIGEILSL
ncbi:hypothetical protein Hte_009171 [Hypoxylon texense]